MRRLASRRCAAVSVPWRSSARREMRAAARAAAAGAAAGSGAAGGRAAGNGDTAGAAAAAIAVRRNSGGTAVAAAAGDDATTAASAGVGAAAARSAPLSGRVASSKMRDRASSWSSVVSRQPPLGASSLPLGVHLTERKAAEKAPGHPGLPRHLAAAAAVATARATRHGLRRRRGGRPWPAWASEARHATRPPNLAGDSWHSWGGQPHLHNA